MSLRERLAEKSRGLGPTDAVVAEMLQSPKRLPELIDALQDERSVVSSRAANALAKLQLELPEEVATHTKSLLRVAATITDLRTRWSLIEVIGRLRLKGGNRAVAIDLLYQALSSPSGFLRAFALTGLVQHAKEDRALGRRLAPVLHSALDDPSAAVRARARKLLGIKRS